MDNGALTKDTSTGFNIRIHLHLRRVDRGIEYDPSTTTLRRASAQVQLYKKMTHKFAVRDDINEDGLLVTG